MRLLALEADVKRGVTAAERSLLAMMAILFAATTARTAVEVAALAETAWGDGQLLVEVRSEHPALAAPATTIALTAATVAIALTGRLSRAIEVWTRRRQALPPSARRRRPRRRSSRRPGACD